MASIVHLLPDEPTTQDAFGTHSRVATAVSELIKNEKSGKAVALIGPWGSGKSSVLNMLQARLTGIADVFIFDAWTHEGDPLRRTFLETLIGAFWRDNPSVEIKNLRDEITLRKTTNEETVTPVLSWEARTLGFSLLVVPIGLAMFAAMVRMKEPSWPLTITALVLALFPLVFITTLGFGVGLRKTLVRLWRSSRKISIGTGIALLVGLAVIAFWYHGWIMQYATTRAIFVLLPAAAVILLALFRSSMSGVLPILLNRTVTTTRSVSIESSEPSSVEFQRWFRSIVALHSRERRRPLIIAIDNLDRIDRALARQLWATMRIFFEFTCGARPEEQRIWLLAAFDKTAIQSLWTVEDPDSFINKTFQASFFVPPLVLIHRDDYLKKQLRAAFPFCGDPQLNLVVRMYALKYSREISTPRSIISFVNSVGSIHRQWRLDEIPLIHQAQYVLAAETGADILSILTSASTASWSPEELVGANWQESLAAIHFNVPPRESAHVFMPPVIINGLLSGDAKKFENLAKLRGFTGILSGVVIQNRDAWKQPDNLSNAILALNSLPHDENDDEIIKTWQIFTTAASRIEKWDLLPQVGPALSILIKRSANNNDQIMNLLKSAGRAIPRTSAGAVDNSEQALSKFIVALAPVFDLLPALPTSFKMTIYGSALTYLNLLLALRIKRSKQFAEIASRLDTESQDQIPSVLAESIKNVQVQENLFVVVKVLSASYSDLNWLPVIQAADNLFTNISNNFLQGGFQATFKILMTLASSNALAVTSLENLARNGTLYHYLGVVEDPQSKDLAILMLALFSDGFEPTSLPGNARQGVSKFQEWLKKPDAESMGTIAALADVFGQVPRLRSRAKGSDSVNDNLFSVLRLIASRIELSAGA